MKNFIMAFFMCFVGIACLLCVVTIQNRSVRNQEVRAGLSEAVEQSVANCMKQNKYAISDAAEFLADFTQALVCNIRSNSSVTVDVMGLDQKKGILSVRVKEKYKNLTGKQSCVDIEKTVIFNQRSEEVVKACEVIFYLSKEDMIAQKNSYKSYQVQPGCSLSLPQIPQIEGKQFNGWADIKDYEADFGQPVQQNLSYYSQWG